LALAETGLAKAVSG